MTSLLSHFLNTVTRLDLYRNILKRHNLLRILINVLARQRGELSIYKTFFFRPRMEITIRKDLIFLFVYTMRDRFVIYFLKVEFFINYSDIFFNFLGFFINFELIEELI